jgi:hypothetical protein
MKKLLVLSVLAVFILGCEPPGAVSPAGSPPDARDIISDAANSPVIWTTKYGPFYDGSGSIETWHHCAVTYGSHNTVMAEVDSSEVLVGGGANVSGGYGLLTGTFPLINKWCEFDTGDDAYYATQWVAQSKDHIVPSNHYLWSQAIGMKLRTQYPNDLNSYLPRAEVLKALRYVTGSSAYVQYPVAYAYAPAGFNLVISGGAQVVNPFNQAGNFLTASYALSGRGGNYPASWFASSKAHGGYNSPTNLNAYAICLHSNTGRGDDGNPDPISGRAPAIPNFGNFNFRFFHYVANNSAWMCQFAPINIPAYTHGRIKLREPLDDTVSWDPGALYNSLPYQYTQDRKPLIFTLTGIGAYDCYSGDGRLLTALWFENTGYSLYINDADHVYPASSMLYPQAIMIIKDGGNDFENKYYQEDGNPPPVVMGNLETSP